jgi:hypothetical protein
MPSFFSGVTGKSSATLFEIRYAFPIANIELLLTPGRLENEVIVLRGAESEASSQMLKGVVVLCLPSALKIEDVHLRMTGSLRVGLVCAFSTMYCSAS